MLLVLLLFAQTRVSFNQVGIATEQTMMGFSDSMLTGGTGIQWSETPRLCVGDQIQAEDLSRIDFNVQDSDTVTTYLAAGNNEHACLFVQASQDVLRSADISTGTYTLKSFVPGQSILTYVLIDRIDPAKAGTCGQPTCFADMGTLQEDVDYTLVGNVLSFIVPLLPGDEVLIQWAR